MPAPVTSPPEQGRALTAKRPIGRYGWFAPVLLAVASALVIVLLVVVP